MSDFPRVSTPKTSQELERAVLQYRNSDLKGVDLFYQWLAIRDASLEQASLEPMSDRVPGEDSY
jgi:hypothetical protein